MDKYLSYLDDMLANHSVTSDREFYSEFKNKQKGGKKDNTIKNQLDDTPNGGFPPIYLCVEKEMKKELKIDEKRKREYKPSLKTVSLKSIIEKNNKKHFL